MNQDTWTLARLLTWSQDYFKKNGIESARLEAELLIAHSLKLRRIELYTQYDRPMTSPELTDYKILIQRRIAREPLAYIVGHKEFYGYRFKVNSNVLIPRPETEELLEKVLEDYPNQQEKLTVIELGIGSGCLSVSFLKNRPEASVCAVDLSVDAIACAQENAAHHGVLNRLQWIASDFRDLDFSKISQVDLLLANLPYVDPEERKDLSPEVLQEPEQALFADQQGFALIAKALHLLPKLLKVKGQAYFEIGYQHRPLIEAYLKDKASFSYQIFKDLAGHDRILKIKLSG